MPFENRPQFLNLRQKVELDKLGQVMRSKDHYGNDQLSGQQVSASLRAVGLTVERSAFASWLRSCDTIGKGIYSIPGAIEVQRHDVLMRCSEILATNINIAKGTTDPGVDCFDQ